MIAIMKPVDRPNVSSRRDGGTRLLTSWRHRLMHRRPASQNTVLRWAAVAVVIAAWELVARAVGSFYFPPPIVIAARTVSEWLPGPATSWRLPPALLDHFLPSLGRAMAGLGLALLGGVAIGTVIGLSRWLADYLEPPIHFVRSIPPVALVPIFIIVIGLGSHMHIALIAFGCLWPILLNTIHGIRSVDRVLLETATTFGIHQGTKVWRVLLPAAAPSVMTGLRISLSLSLILMVVAEMMTGSGGGIGVSILIAQRGFNVVNMWTGLVVIGVLGYSLNLVLDRAEARLVGWHRKQMEVGA